MTGIDRFLSEKKESSKKIGLITNPTGITSRGIPVWQALINEGFNLKALFGPEHGFRGEAQDAVIVGDEFFKGIPVYSLYGSRLAPDSAMLSNLDTLLFDIQEVGCRYYTYLYTLAYSMEVCEATGTEIIVTDRPNPILDKSVEGSPIEKEFESFVGGFGLPVTTGLTICEYALYLKDNFFPKVNLKTIPMEGYRRNNHVWDQNLAWHLPSPNLPTRDTALVYPGTCLIEGTSLSEGRGTTRPFEIIGAPFIDGEELREALRQQDLPGIIFTSLFFTPTFSKWKGETCEGVLLNVTDRKAFRPLATGITILHTILSLYPGKVIWLPDWEKEEDFFFDKLAGTDSLRNSLDELEPIRNIIDEINRDAAGFEKRNEKYYLYQE
ncbi:MAG: DUF1343 domain-containing protein [Spirochaetales bacterium]|nr:DUF1343 domain-containing protein [Spirochaetales bacterium]